ncbi:MAG: hypothetical protein JOZ93_03045 [Sinobacteraceae bacterium]|nr:hypothetical protein [Nevskiaceae bacterium]MBV9911522.1 hypothetical protein [Nevskiaceae bacterium]
MQELIRLFAQVALLRRGPQDLPASALLLGLTIAGYFAVNFLISSLLPPFQGPWIAHLCVDVVFMFAWYTLLLRIVGKPERFLQTATAVYGFQLILSPLLIAAEGLTRRFPQDSLGQFAISLLSLGMLIWIIAANSHIVKAALEWSLLPSVALVILQTLAGTLLMLELFPIPG